MTTPTDDREPALLACELDAGSPAHVRLWDAVNEYAAACGGDSGSATISGRRMHAVALVDQAVIAILKADRTPTHPPGTPAVGEPLEDAGPLFPKVQLLSRYEGPLCEPFAPPKPGELTAKQQARADRIVRDASRDWSLPADSEEGVCFDTIVREAVELALVEENIARAALPRDPVSLGGAQGRDAVLEEAPAESPDTVTALARLVYNAGHAYADGTVDHWAVDTKKGRLKEQRDAAIKSVQLTLRAIRALSTSRDRGTPQTPGRCPKCLGFGTVLQPLPHGQTAKVHCPECAEPTPQTPGKEPR